MKLSFEQIKNLTVGALEIWEDNGVHFSKCTFKQIDMWKNESDFLFSTSKATTGVRLDFLTNSSFVKFALGSKGRYEVLENGLLKEKFESEEDENREIVFNFKSEGLNRFTLTMPSHCYSGVLKSVEVCDGAVIERPNYSEKILFLGDSITQGGSSNYDSNSYAYLTSKFLNAESVIQGVGGAYFARSTLDKINFEPNTVFIAYGTNDVNFRPTLNELLFNAEEYFNGVKSLFGGAEIFVITPIWRADFNQEMKVGNFENACKKIGERALSFGFNVIDGLKLVPWNKDYLADGVHPNDLGFYSFATNLVKEVLKIRNK